MKKLFTILAAAACTQIHAQVTDTVSTGAGYANQVWYSLENDEQGSSAKNNWDLAFSIANINSPIYTNSANGVVLWNYPKGDVSAWSSVDTTGLSTWASRNNSDTTWDKGAMGNYRNPANPYDLDWGVYNMTTHSVAGDSIYIIKLSDGSYRKLIIESLSGGTYSFKYAKLDGSDPKTASLVKTSYPGQNFGYYSLKDDKALSREPASTDWDLVFGQYTAFVPTPYTVTGVLQNIGTRAAKVTKVGDVATYTSYGSATFNSEINILGWDWKTLNMSTSPPSFAIEDSTVYFVQTQAGSIWKVVFLGFGGSANGNYIFSKQKLAVSTAVHHLTGEKTGSMALYPNPAANSNVTVVYSFTSQAGTTTLTVTDLTGRVALAETLSPSNGLSQHTLNTSSLAKGTYMVKVSNGNSVLVQKLSVQ